jgi:hypothetical protein
MLVRSHKTLIINLAVLAILALVGSACGSAATPTPTPTAVATEAPLLPAEAYPQPYPLETFDPYLAPVDPYPSAYPAAGAPLVPGQGAGLYPGAQDGAEVMWHQAVAMILNGEAAQVMQTHDLKVYVTLKDGRTLLAIEPEIDEVMRVIEICGDPCKDVLVATE